MTVNSESPLPKMKGIQEELAQYLQVCLTKYRTCIAELTHSVTLSNSKATMHLQYVRFDPNSGEPKFDVLAKVLSQHVVSYALSTSTREDVRKRIGFKEDEGELYALARDYFRKIKDSGEVGELLLFFLLEAAFGAPQLVCKMGLKTNARDEVKGADGIHARWDEAGNHLDVYLGESKLYQDMSSALTDAFDSISSLYDEGRLDQELQLVTSQFKYLDPELKAAVTRFTNRTTAENECHVIHACLIGWDWNEYKKLATDKRNDVINAFDDNYRQYASKIDGMLKTRFDRCKHKQLSFKFLFLPFRSVGEFRRAFYKELCGVDIGHPDD